MYLVGKTPPTLPFLQGVTVAFASYAGDQLALRQKRKFFVLGLKQQQSKVGLGTPELRAQWATLIHGNTLVGQEQDQSRPETVDGRVTQGHAWKGFWVPFQNQVHAAVRDDDSGEEEEEEGEHSQQDAKKIDVSKVKVGEGCDLVVLYFHGGGFLDGYAHQSLDMFCRVMKEAQEKHNLKVGFLSVEYSKCRTQQVWS